MKTVNQSYKYEHLVEVMHPRRYSGGKRMEETGCVLSAAVGRWWMRACFGLSGATRLRIYAPMLVIDMARGTV